MPYNVTSELEANKVYTKDECLNYDIELTQPSGDVKHRLVYQLFCIDDGAFITSQQVSASPCVMLNFSQTVCGHLDTPCPTETSSFTSLEEDARKSVSLFLNTLEINTEDCTSELIDGFSTNEARMINSNVQCDEYIDWSQPVALTNRPRVMSFCEDADYFLNIWFPSGGGTINVMSESGNIGSTNVSTSVGDVFGIEPSIFAGLANESITIEVAGTDISYTYVFDECCCCQEVKFFEPIGGWTNLNMCIEGKPFTTTSEEINKRDGCNCSFDRINTDARIQYTLTAEFCKQDLKPNFLEGLAAASKAGIKVNGKWIDFKISDGTFETYNETNEVIFSVTGSYAKKFNV